MSPKTSTKFAEIEKQDRRFCLND